MLRPLTALLALTLAAAACSDSAGDDLSYFDDAARVSSTYELAAGAHFDIYRTALETATPETGDDIYVSASRDLFAGLAPDLDQAVAGLNDLVPPDDLEAEHAAWLASADALNTAIQDTNGEIAPLTEADAVAEILGTVNLVELQDAYRTACRAVHVEHATGAGLVTEASTLLWFAVDDGLPRRIVKRWTFDGTRVIETLEISDVRVNGTIGAGTFRPEIPPGYAVPGRKPAGPVEPEPAVRAAVEP